MSDSISSTQSSTLPQRFLGTWKVLATGKAPHNDVALSEVTIDPPEAVTQPYVMGSTMKDSAGELIPLTPSYLTYDSNTDTLVSGDGELAVSFWRNPSADMIFALHREQRVWTARRVLDTPSEIPVITNNPWTIMYASGHHAREINAEVVLDKIYFGIAPGDQDSPLFGLFQLVKDVPQLYDILRYHESDRCFVSIFGVRSVNYWNEAGRKKALFATFDNRFSTPAGHFGKLVVVPGTSSKLVTRHLGQLMDFEQEGLGSDDDDPDAGCWYGEPP